MNREHLVSYPTSLAPPILSQDSLELLLVSVVSLKTRDGLALDLWPADVLQPWVVAQIPEEALRR